MYNKDIIINHSIREHLYSAKQPKLFKGAQDSWMKLMLIHLLEEKTFEEFLENENSV
jgi:hypothetical protein